MLNKPKDKFPANVIHDGSEEVVTKFPQSVGQLGNIINNNKERQSQNKCYWKMDPAVDCIARKDSCSAARFFYCAKASKKDRGEGNTHPTVKSTELMKYLCKLITPPGGTVLDPFMGSGSTGVAAIQEGFNFLGIEKEPTYFEIAEKRIKESQNKKIT